MLPVLVILGAASAAPTTAKESTYRQAGSVLQAQVPAGIHGSGSIAPASGQMAAYFDPHPAPFKSFTYAASIQLGPSASKRTLQGELRFPAFSATPNVSVQIISSTAAAPVQVYALKIEEVSGMSGEIETQIIVEAETIFGVPANGIYYANLVVIGVPVVPPTKAKSAQFLH